VARLGPGRARTRPDRVLADKAYTSKANPGYLREALVEVGEAGDVGGDDADGCENHDIERTRNTGQNPSGMTRPTAGAERLDWLPGVLAGR
jgi:hypothetical protein